MIQKFSLVFVCVIAYGVMFSSEESKTEAKKETKKEDPINVADAQRRLDEGSRLLEPRRKKAALHAQNIMEAILGGLNQVEREVFKAERSCRSKKVPFRPNAFFKKAHEEELVKLKQAQEKLSEQESLRVLQAHKKVEKIQGKLSKSEEDAWLKCSLYFSTEGEQS